MTNETLSSKIFIACLNEECLPIIKGKYLFFEEDVKDFIQIIQDDVDKLPDKIQFKDSGTKIWVDYRKVIEIIKKRAGDALIHSPLTNPELDSVSRIDEDNTPEDNSTFAKAEPSGTHDFYFNKWHGSDKICVNCGRVESFHPWGGNVVGCEKFIPENTFFEGRDDDGDLYIGTTDKKGDVNFIKELKEELGSQYYYDKAHKTIMGIIDKLAKKHGCDNQDYTNQNHNYPRTPSESSNLREMSTKLGVRDSRERTAQSSGNQNYTKDELYDNPEGSDKGDKK